MMINVCGFLAPYASTIGPKHSRTKIVAVTDKMLLMLASSFVICNDGSSNKYGRTGEKENQPKKATKKEIQLKWNALKCGRRHVKILIFRDRPIESKGGVVFNSKIFLISSGSNGAILCFYYLQTLAMFDILCDV